METRIDEIGDEIYRISTFIEPANLVFNQFLVLGDEPLLWHLGHRQLFPLVSDAVAQVLPVDRLRWLSFAHVEADECGAMNRWLAAAPRAQVVHGATGVLVSLNDMADRPPRMVADGEVVDLGGKRVRWIDTPHVPHGWESGLVFEEVTQTLFAGDLFTAAGPAVALTDGDIVGPAVAAEDLYRATAITPATGPTIRRLAPAGASTLALMHGPAFSGDVAGALESLAADYDRRLVTGDPTRGAG